MAEKKHHIAIFMKYYNANKKAVYNYCLKMLNNKENVNDVVQNVFMKFYENISQIRDTQKIPVWLFTTARNEIYAIYRSKNSPLRLLDKDDMSNLQNQWGEDIESIVENKELKNIILDELQNFSEEMKETFYLREFGGLTYKEISEVLNVEVNVIKSRLYKTRHRLIDKISKLI